MNTHCSDSSISVRHSSTKSRTAVVAEGGGQRGIYTAGVLDTFLLSGFNPFEIGIGTSAGAQNLLTYFMGLPGYAKRAIVDLSSSPEFFVPYRWLGRCGVLDLDTYFSHMLNHSDYRLPYNRISTVRKRRQLMFVATKRSTLAATYLEPKSHNVITCMKASSAVPFLYKEGVSIDDEILVDGGVSDPIPVQEAYAQGACKIVVIRTVPGDQTQSCWRNRIDSLKLTKALPVSIMDMLERHEQGYDQALTFMRNPPKDVEILEIAPDTPLQSSLFGSSSKALLADYETGCRAGDSALQRLLHWQSQEPVVSKHLLSC